MEGLNHNKGINNDQRVQLFRNLSEQFSLIPLNGKQPIELGWTKWCTQKRPFEPNDFQSRNAGIACGPASGVLVLDIDNYLAFSKTCKKNGWHLPKTRTHLTGSGKIHYLYAYPKDGKRYGCCTIKGLDGKNVADIKGLGGQVVAPGSDHPDTEKPYKVGRNEPIAPAPEWLLKPVECVHRSGVLGKAQAKEINIREIDVKSLPVSKDTKDLIKQGKPKGERSEAIMSVIVSLVSSMHSDSEIISVFETSDYKIGEKYREKGNLRFNWLQKQIDKARTYIGMTQEEAGKLNGIMKSSGGEPKEDDYGKTGNITSETNSKITFSIVDNIVSGKDFLKRPIEKRPSIMSPWLKEGTLAMIYSLRGVGKTFLALLLALALVGKRTIGLWKVDHPTECLYIDGEMSADEMQERVNRLCAGMHVKPDNFHLYSSDLTQRKKHPAPKLSDHVWRKEMYNYLEKHRNIKVLILDNIAALTPGVTENEKEAWDPINQWLLSLRFLGVAVILLHHSGKSGQQRGTSGREDALDVVIKLERPLNYKPNQGAMFNVIFEKARSVTGDDTSEITLAVVEDSNGNLKVEMPKVDESTKAMVIAMLANGVSPKDITKKLKCSKQNVSHHKVRAIRDGFLDRNCKFTPEGKKKYGHIFQTVVKQSNTPIPKGYLTD